MQMFLISGIGTAVKTQSKIKQSSEDSIIDGHDVKRMTQSMIYDKLISKYLQSARNNEHFVYSSQFTNLTDIVKKCVTEMIKINSYNLFTLMFNCYDLLREEDLVEAIKAYCWNNADDAYSQLLSACLDFYNQNPMKGIRFSQNAVIKQIVSGIPSVPLHIVQEYLQQFPVYFWDNLFLPVLKKYREYYTNESINDMNVLIDQMKNKTLTPLPVETNKRGKEKWACICGEKNSIDRDRCDLCLTNQFGMTKTKTEEIENTIEFLSNIVCVLDECLK